MERERLREDLRAAVRLFGRHYDHCKLSGRAAGEVGFQVPYLPEECPICIEQRQLAERIRVEHDL